MYCQPSDVRVAKFNVVPEGIGTDNALTVTLVALTAALAAAITTLAPMVAVAPEEMAIAKADM
jgi:hypothetical protein